MAPKNLNFRMAISEEFRKTWSLFNSRAKIEEITTAELVKDLIEDYMEEFGDEIESPESIVEETNVPKKKMVKRVLPPKKTFVSKRVNITRKKVDSSDDEYGIQDTPKFKFLELMRFLDSGDGVDPDKLRKAAQDKGIINPRLQLNKMMRRGILYEHKGFIHLT